MRVGWIVVGMLTFAVVSSAVLGDDAAPTTQSATEPAKATEGKLLSGAPVLRADNIWKLATFYRDKLGFKVLFGGEKQSGYAVIERDDFIMHITRPEGEFGAVSVYVYVKNVDALYAEFVARGVKTDGKPTVEGYGFKDFSVTDAEGNRVNFGQEIDRH